MHKKYLSQDPVCSLPMTGLLSIMVIMGLYLQTILEFCIKSCIDKMQSTINLFVYNVEKRSIHNIIESTYPSPWLMYIINNIVQTWITQLFIVIKGLWKSVKTGFTPLSQSWIIIVQQDITIFNPANSEVPKKSKWIPFRRLQLSYNMIF